MSERRPFPPSPRRLALARQAGLTSASPLIVGAIAAAGAVLAAVMLARAAAGRLGAWIADACTQAATLDTTSDPSGALPGGAGALPASHASTHLDTALTNAAHAVLELAIPLLAAAALAAVFAHLAQTRTAWLPRRRISGAPAMPRSSGVRASFDLASGVVIGCVAFGWLWVTAPRLAALFSLEDQNAAARSTAPMLVAIGASLATLIVTLAIAWLALGVFDALLRNAQLAGALAMTPTEKREEDRIAAADPRWAQRRRAVAREPAVGPAVARAAVLLLGDDVAVAVAWDPVRQPVPRQTAVGRGARATQLLALARRYRVRVHRDVALAADLAGKATAPSDAPVPEAHWARLADIVAAVRPR